MKKIGIKLADGSFYPILDEGTPKKRMLDLTTVKDNQTKVQVDLYRSELGSMEDAEYVDTLEVTNLEPHPNGEPELHLSVGLDENNELTAEVVDPETGTKSETQVQLVSRTLAERDSTPTDFSLSEANSDNASSATDDFSFDDFELPTDSTETVIGGDSESSSESEGEVDVAEQNDNDMEMPDIVNSEDVPFSFEESVDSTQETSDSSDFDLDEISVPVTADAETLEKQSLEETTEDSSIDSTALGVAAAAGIAAGAAAYALSNSNNSDEQNDQIEETVAEDGLSEQSFNIEENSEPSTESSTDDIFGEISTENSLETSTESATDDTFEMPDFDNLENNSSSSEESFNEESFNIEENNDIPQESTNDDIFGEESLTDENLTADSTVESSADDSFDLPDFGETEISDTTETTESTESTESTEISNDDFSLPDFDETSVSDESSQSFTEESFDLPDFDDNSTSESSIETETQGLSGYFDDPTFEEPLFTNDNLDKEENSSSMDFSDLYDNETIAGEHATPYTEDEDEGKRKKSVVICIICAIICLIATALILFIIPSKYNLLNKGDDVDIDNEIELLVEKDLPPPPPPVKNEMIAPEAQEDKIVIASEAETVVPVPKVAQSQAKDDIRYKIKWGDTLWDLAGTFYKKPWKYMTIAEYNKIKNPDKIISGTYINIPSEN